MSYPARVSHNMAQSSSSHKVNSSIVLSPVVISLLGVGQYFIQLIFKDGSSFKSQESENNQQC